MDCASDARLIANLSHYSTLIRSHSLCSACAVVSDDKMTAILDQKHYIEELNRHLSCTVTDLQAKMDALEKTNSKLIEEVSCLITCFSVMLIPAVASRFSFHLASPINQNILYS